MCPRFLSPISGAGQTSIVRRTAADAPEDLPEGLVAVGRLQAIAAVPMGDGREARRVIVATGGRARRGPTDNRRAGRAGRVGEGIAPRSHSGRHRPPVFTGSTDSDAMSRMCGATTLNILKYTPQANFWAAVMLLRNNMHKSYASRDADPDRRSTVSLRPFWWALLICLISGHHRWQSPWGPDRRFCARCLRRERVARRGEWVVDRRPKVRWGEIRRPQ